MSLSKAEHDELCCVYAGLLLHDDKIDITADNIKKIIKASGNEVDDYYPEFFAKYLKKNEANLKSMLTVSAAPAGEKHEEVHEDKKDGKKDDKKGGKKDDKKGGKKEKEKPAEKPKEDEEDDVGFGDIFG